MWDKGEPRCQSPQGRKSPNHTRGRGQNREGLAPQSGQSQLMCPHSYACKTMKKTFLHSKDFLLYKCFKAKYFWNYYFLEATDWPGSSFFWRGILAAKPLLLIRGTCWRVGYCQEITVTKDKMFAVFYSQALLYIEDDVRVCDLIDLNTSNVYNTHLVTCL